MHALLSRLTGGEESDTGCRCQAAVEDERLVVDASDCPADGRLSESGDCRETVVDALTTCDVETVVTRTAGTARHYADDAAALLVAAGRFAEATRFHDERLAQRALSDPLGAAHEATGRAGPPARIAAETGLAAGADRAVSYEDALRPFVGPCISRWRVADRLPTDARLADRRTVDSTVVRVYERPGDAVRTYHVEPPEHRIDDSARETLSTAADYLANETAEDATTLGPGRAVRAVATDDDPVETLRTILRKHTSGYGVVEDLFADGRISDVFVTAPATENPVRVRVDGESMRTNVRLTESGAEALASQFRRESGRAFSGADPTLDASISTAERQLRVAGVTAPASHGFAFAFRARDSHPWTLPALVANETLTAESAALLSLAVDRGAAGLVAGPRSAGKTTLLGALLWEVPPRTRTIVIEDTPELPVDGLQENGRDVQRLRTALDDSGPSPSAMLRTALRLGDGALVVGEIRGDEAGTLYEAMRVGSNDGAVLGTIHGDGGADVRERLVSDLGVPESSFGVTDLLVTMETSETPAGRKRRLRAIEEVRSGKETVSFATLFERTGDGLASTDCLARGNSHLVEGIRRPDESYATVRERLSAREEWIVDMVGAGRTDPSVVEQSRAERRWET